MGIIWGNPVEEGNKYTHILPVLFSGSINVLFYGPDI